MKSKVLFALFSLALASCGGEAKKNKISADPDGPSAGSHSQNALSWARGRVSCQGGSPKTIPLEVSGGGGVATGTSYVGSHRGGHVLVLERTESGGLRAFASICQDGPFSKISSARLDHFRPVAAKRDCPHGDINRATITVSHPDIEWYTCRYGRCGYVTQTDITIGPIDCGGGGGGGGWYDY